MWKDPIVQEVREARDDYARKFGFDLKRIFDDLKRKQAARIKKTAAPPKKKPAARLRKGPKRRAA